jgi:RNA polymerase sigma-70 factor (ECF subfamily)
VYEATVDGLASFAFGMLGNRAGAEDAVQQAFLELVTAASGFRGDGRSLRVWLYRSVRFTCLDELRRRARRPEHLTDRLPEQSEESIPDVPPELEEALARLTGRQRSLLMLRHVAGLSPEDIARVTKSNRGAVYAALARAEKRLRLSLDPVVRS